jgi:NitT/TauT family transport system substrate-binding protein
MGLASAAVTAALAFGAQAEPLKLRLHWAQSPGHWAPLTAKVADRLGVQPHYGKSYVVEPVFIAGAGPALQALAAGELEITGLSPQAFALGVIEGKLDLKVIGQQLSNDVPGYAGNSFWVRKDDIKSIAELRGKTLGVNARGSTIDAALRTMMTRHGLEDGADYQVVEVRFPAQLAALKSRRIDLAMLVRPWDVEGAKDPTLAPLFTMADAIGPTETIITVTKGDFIAKHRAALVDFFEDNIRLRRWAAGAGHDEAVKLVAEIAKKSVEEVASSFTKEDGYRDPNAAVNLPRLQKNIDDLVKVKLLARSIDVNAHADPTVAADAARRVGPSSN